MIRNGKRLFLVLVAAGALLGLGGSVARAAEFHCSVQPCVATLGADETAGTKTAHHVLVIRKIVEGIERSGAITCNQLTGKAESSTKTTSEFRITNLQFDSCSLAGTIVVIHVNGCSWAYGSNTGILVILCGPGQGPIEITIGQPVQCIITIGGQELKGVKYHNIGSEATNTTEITLETLLKGIRGSAGAGCKVFVGFEGEFTESEYTTGNTRLTGETSAGVMANAWWT